MLQELGFLTDRRSKRTGRGCIPDASSGSCASSVRRWRARTPVRIRSVPGATSPDSSFLRVLCIACDYIPEALGAQARLVPVESRIDERRLALIRGGREDCQVETAKKRLVWTILKDEESYHMSALLIRDVTLVDGTGAPPRSGVSVLVDGPRIVAIAGPELVAPPGAAEVHGHGHFLLPGFFDCHVHLMAEGPDLLGQLLKPPSYLVIGAVERMRRTLDAGVTTVRDLGGADRGLKMAREEGRITGPRLQVAVRILSITGGHGDLTFAGTAATVEPHLMEELVDGDGVLAGVRRVIREGADVVKVCTTGGVLSPGDDPRHAHFSPEELSVIAQEARRQGRRLAAHAQGSEGIKNAVRAGWTSIEHGIFLDQEGIDLMLAAGTFLIPTLVAPRAVLEARERGLPVPDWAVEKTKRVLEAHQENIARAHAAGVRIALGTDAGVGPHGQNLRELMLLQEIGLSPMEAIVAGTQHGAQVMGLEGELGTIEVGKLADLILTDVDPLAHLGALADPDRIRMVIQDGQVVKDLRERR